MRLTFVITIDPVKAPSLLSTVVHSLNLQTQRNFAVVFYNQTRFDEDGIFGRLAVTPEFEHRFFSIPDADFFGRYPLWDLYAFHRYLLDQDLLDDYFMSTHMEEFFDVDYVAKVTRVLAATDLDILFGNLCRTDLNDGDLRDLLAAPTAADFERYVHRRGLKRAPHFQHAPLPWRPRAMLRVLARNLRKRAALGLRNGFAPTAAGFTRLRRYTHEDVYFMKAAFARRTGWLLPGRSLPFEDIHICDQPSVCELGDEIAAITDFPSYFNLSRIYHVPHGRFYYQIADRTFADGVLALDTDHPVLCTLQAAIRMYRSGELSLESALAYSRRNAAKMGTQDLNYRYHLDALAAARADLGGIDTDDPQRGLRERVR